MTLACLQALANHGGAHVAMSEAVRSAVLQRVTQYGLHHALRCLALAYRPLPPGGEQVPVLACRASKVLVMPVAQPHVRMTLRKARTAHTGGPQGIRPRVPSCSLANSMLHSCASGPHPVWVLGDPLL